jgi:hypothetical protein
MLSYKPGMANVAAVDQQLQDGYVFLEDIKQRLLQAQVTMKSTQDKSRERCNTMLGIGFGYVCNNGQQLVSQQQHPAN